MRLIDADELMRKYHVSPVWDSWLEINNAPTVDAVPVVRCKDCKYFTLSPYGCGKWKIDMEYGDEQNNFCSYGERRGRIGG